MTTDDFISRVDVLNQKIKDSLTTDILVTYSTGLAAKIANRVQKTQILGSGNTYFYSNYTMQQEDYKKKKNAPRKDYRLTGEMWNGFGIKEVKKQTNTVILGGKTTVSQYRINKNSERDSDNIIAANEQEEKELADAVAKKVKELIHDTLFN